ncbi:MAG: ribosome small subunit-dependent GTPase A [Chitinivibrionales bacterium]|nr:ribosome small subunit-dependent GTPase A [Chitinivibrionales bacterium]
MNIETIGWDPQFQAQLEDIGCETGVAARVSREHRGAYTLLSALGELWAQPSGRFLHRVDTRDQLPAVGDWVAVEPVEREQAGIIHAVLPRRSSFSRAAVGGRTEKQVLAANVDTCFLVSGLGADFNPRRIERYLSAAWDSGAMPVVLLNKADTVDDPAAFVDQAEAVAPGVPVVALSAVTGAGFDGLGQWTGPGRTVVFLGSSGVGKSTIANRLLGEETLATGDTRAQDGRGRHTTTHRELLPLPGGGVVIDTPGLRELQAWYDNDSVSGAFADIAELAGYCRFGDCTHRSEPGCAVRGAVANGALDEHRLANYFRMQREERYLEVRRDDRQRHLERKRQKKFTKANRDYIRHKRGM